MIRNVAIINNNIWNISDSSMAQVFGLSHGTMCYQKQILKKWHRSTHFVSLHCQTARTPNHTHTYTHTQTPTHTYHIYTQTWNHIETSILTNTRRILSALNKKVATSRPNYKSQKTKWVRSIKNWALTKLGPIVVYFSLFVRLELVNYPTLWLHVVGESPKAFKPSKLLRFTTRYVN